MFHLITKDRFNKFNVVYNFLVIKIPLFSLSFFLLIFNINFLFFDKSFNIIDFNAYTLVSIILFITIVVIIKLIVNFRFKKQMMREFYLIIKETHIPAKNPKVLYLYTTRNDFDEWRLKQNLLQTYKNIETWILVSNKDDKYLDKIKEFSKENNVHLWISENPSISKANNINKFLLSKKVDYDYLLLGDADVAFDKNFVEYSLKLFYSKNAIRLGFVSSTVMNYRGNNVFTNAFYNIENDQFIFSHVDKNFKFNLSPNLYSSCSLITKDLIDEMGGILPESNLEDWYTEKFANKHEYAGIINPLCIAMQSYDKDIFAAISRNQRLYSWGIKFNKEQHFKRLNVRYSTQNNLDFLFVFLGLYLILGTLLLTVSIWLFIDQIEIFKIKSLFILLVVSLSCLIVGININMTIRGRIFKKDNIKRSVLSVFFGIALMFFTIKTWFNSLFLSKYSSFANPMRRKKYPYWLTFIFSFITLIVVDFCYCYFGILKVEYRGLMYLFILLNVVLLLLAIFGLSIPVLSWVGKIESNKNFNVNKFIYCENKWVAKLISEATKEV